MGGVDGVFDGVVWGGGGGGKGGEEVFEGGVDHVASEAGGVDVGAVEGAEGGAKPGTKVVGGDARGWGRDGEVEEVGSATCGPWGENALNDLGDEIGVGGLDGGASRHVT